MLQAYPAKRDSNHHCYSHRYHHHYLTEQLTHLNEVPDEIRRRISFEKFVALVAYLEYVSHPFSRTFQNTEDRISHSKKQFFQEKIY
jgi:hypothetical protein